MPSFKPLHRALLALLPLAAPAAAFAETPPPGPAYNSDERKLDPAAELRSFKVADGFEISLFASDPMIAKPIQMTWDARGRLWVVSSSLYPMIRPGQAADDKVIILEDTAGVGRADKATVFADGLQIPTGIALGDGGAYVANSTEIVHLADTKGGDHADSRRVVLSGFGTEDTHHIIHTFRWGVDGRLYFNQSVYIHTHVETPWGTQSMRGGGVWRFRPESMKLNVRCLGGWNPWGHAWDAQGQEYLTDGAFGEGPYFVEQGATYPGSVETNHYLNGLNPGSPKYCGLEILGGRHLPEDYRGDLLTNDFRAHRIVRFKLTESGAGVSSKQMPDFIVSSDVDFRPIDIKMGPDGAIYIADWCNPIINHGEVDFRDPRRDHVHGRISHMTAKGRPLVQKPKLDLATAELLDRLKDPEAWTRDQVRLILRERAHAGKAVAAELAVWVQKLPPADEQSRLEALWCYETIDVPEPALLRELLAAKEPSIRAAAVRTLAHWIDQTPGAAEKLAVLVTDDSAHVRQEAVRALALVPRPESAVIAMKAMDKGTDRFLNYALSLTANDLKDVWVPAFKAGKLADWGDARHLAFALQAANAPEALGALVKQLKAGQIPPAARSDVYGLIGSMGGPDDLGLLFIEAENTADPAVRVRILKDLDRAARQRQVLGTHINWEAFGQLLADNDSAVAAAAVRLLGAYQQKDQQARIEQYLIDPTTPWPVRAASASTLGDLAGNNALTKLTAADHPLPVRVAATVALTPSMVPKDAAKQIVALLRDPKIVTASGDDITPLVSAILDREGFSEAVTAAVKANPLSADVAKVALRALQSSGRIEQGLMVAFRDSAGVGGETHVLTPDEMKTWVDDVTKIGDAARGEKLFRSKELACYGCHAIAAVGGQIAPDLRTIGASAPVDYLIDSVLYPNKAVKEGYNAIQVSTKKGEIFSGIVAREDAKELVLKDNLHDEIVVNKADIKKRKDIGSLMPAGLADGLTHAEFSDLIRFLSELGKPGPYAVGNAPLVRRWRVLEGSSPVPAAVATAMSDAGANWQPAYSRVSGDLPLDAFGSDAAKAPAPAYARCEIEATTPGQVRLLLNSADGLKLWLDGRPVGVSTDAPLELSRGIHTLTFAVDLNTRKSALRAELGEAPGSPARAQPITGK